MKVPEGYYYTRNHEWIRKVGSYYEIGISDHAQEQLGEIVYLELPETGDEVTAGEAFGVVESTKAVSDVFAPASGTVSERNEFMLENDANLTLINEEPYSKGWLIRIVDVNESDLEDLMDASAYEEFIEEESE